MDGEGRGKKRRISLPLMILIGFISGILFLSIFLIYTINYGEIMFVGFVITRNFILQTTTVFAFASLFIYIYSLFLPSKPSTHEEHEKHEERVETREMEVVEVPSSEEEGIERLPMVEFIEVDPPYVYAGIVRVGNSLEYHVIEPALTVDEDLLIKEIDRKLYEELDIDLLAVENHEGAVKYLKDSIQKLVKRYKWDIDPAILDKIIYYIIRDHIGYGKIDSLMKDENIEDISCNGPEQPVYIYHRFYESLPTNIKFEEEELDNFVIRLAYLSRRHVSISTPIVDATLPDGTRVNITFRKEVSRRGSTFSIRKFKKTPFTIINLIKFKTLDEKIGAFIWEAVENMSSILVAGGTATGKTTLLNAISLFLRPETKIVSIEDTAELQLYHENWNPLVERTGFGVRGSEAEIRMFELLKAALRQRPNVIIVGEVRGEEAYTMFQAMATGHGGLGSIHAESTKAVIDRLVSEPMNVPPALILTLDSIILISRVKIGEKIFRKIIEIGEPYWNDEKSRIEINKTFSWNPYKNEFEQVGESHTLEKIGLTRGIDVNDIKKNIERKERILRWMVKKNIVDYKSFTNIISRYYRDPEELYEIATYELLSMEEG